MAIVLLAAFILVPLIEIAVFIKVGGWIGLWPTLALIVLTAVLGTWQLRAQGIATLARARSQMERGVMPARELFDGLCLLVAGALLLTPGFVTDAMGGLLFVPPPDAPAPPVPRPLPPLREKSTVSAGQCLAWRTANTKGPTCLPARKEASEYRMA